MRVTRQGRDRDVVYHDFLEIIEPPRHQERQILPGPAESAQFAANEFGTDYSDLLIY